MFSKVKSLFLFAFVVHWSTGHGLFFGSRWDSTSSGSDNSRAQTHNYNAVTQWNRPPTPVPVQAEALIAANEIIPPPAATIPLPIAIQLPQQILPLAMYPAIQAPIQTYKSGHRPTSHHSNAIPYMKISQGDQTIPYVRFSQAEQTIPYMKISQSEQASIPYVKFAQAEQPIPYVKISQADQTVPYVKIAQGEQTLPYVKISQGEQTLPLPVAPSTTIAAVRFVPCFCGNNNNEEKRGFSSTEEKRGFTRTSIPLSAPTTGIQPVHLLPCYCPIVREVEPHFVQSSPVPSSTAEPAVREYSPSTIQPKS